MNNILLFNRSLACCSYFFSG